MTSKYISDVTVSFLWNHTCRNQKGPDGTPSHTAQHVWLKGSPTLAVPRVIYILMHQVGVQEANRTMGQAQQPLLLVLSYS